MIDHVTIELEFDGDVWHACVRLTPEDDDFTTVGSHPDPSEAVGIALADLEKQSDRPAKSGLVRR